MTGGDGRVFAASLLSPGKLLNRDSYFELRRIHGQGLPTFGDLLRAQTPEPHRGQAAEPLRSAPPGPLGAVNRDGTAAAPPSPPP